MRSESAIVELSVGSLVAPVFLQPFLPLAGTFQPGALAVEHDGSRIGRLGTPPNPKQMTGSEFTFTPVTNKTDLTTMTGTAIATIVTRTNIGGSGGSGRTIGTITIRIMIGSTTEINVSRFFCPRYLRRP